MHNLMTYFNKMSRSLFLLLFCISGREYISHLIMCRLIIMVWQWTTEKFALSRLKRVWSVNKAISTSGDKHQTKSTDYLYLQYSVPIFSQDFPVIGSNPGPQKFKVLTTNNKIKKNKKIFTIFIKFTDTL